MMKIKKVLIANRGEIALRVMRSLKEMGISTVAIYSEADRNSPHVSYADEAACVGPPSSAKSYLAGDKIIEICRKMNVDAIHPGYGFLSENADFARQVEKSGIIFIGPSPEAMEIMGNKLAAKAAVKKYKIPMVPGTDEAITDKKSAKEKAKKIGFPVIIKASAGGGGKGMRIVDNAAVFEEQMERAASEAQSAFGDGSVFIEKYIPSPKHIEIQVLADSHGNIVHLFERDCSVQRRHQKVIEEAPSSAISGEMRTKMGHCAVKVAKACNYTGAGTVEFLYDNKNFYFLEMNTRLQVEHPVTEFITGVDLVKEQVKIAQGEELSFKQEDIKINGHAVEVRVYAEDPANNFLPDVGKLNIYKRPHGAGVRVDDGFEQGMDIPIYYDPMIAKLITHGKTREEAITKMLRAISDYSIAGVETTLPFCKFVLEHKIFISGKFDTHFVQNYFKPEMIKQIPSNDEEEIAAFVAAMIADKHISKKTIVTDSNNKLSKWKSNR